MSFSKPREEPCGQVLPLDVPASKGCQQVVGPLSQHVQQFYRIPYNLGRAKHTHEALLFV